MSASIESIVPNSFAPTSVGARSTAYSRPQIPALTGLRFFAAFFILWGHSIDWLVQFQDSRIKTYFTFVGTPGMSLFFVLSGFVIHYNYRDLFLRGSIPRAVSEFAAARFARLYPLYLVFLVVAIAADNFLAASGSARPILGYFITLTQSWWYTVYNNQLIINSLFPLSWSISTEMFFYAFYPVVIFLIASVVSARRMIYIAVLFAGAVLVSLVASRIYQGSLLQLAQSYIPDYIAPEKAFNNSFYFWFFYYSPYMRVLEFLLGCMTAQAIMQLASQPAAPREQYWGAFAVGAALLALVLISLLEGDIIHAPVLNGYVHHLEQSFLCSPPIAVIVFCVSRYRSWFARFLSLPSLLLLGEMSYSIYLVHIWTLRLFLHPARAFTSLEILDAVLCVVCGIALTLLLSYGTYYLIEMPGRQWLRRWLGRAIAVAFGDGEKRVPVRIAFPRLANVGRVTFSVSVAFALAATAFAGQAARSGPVIEYVHNLLYHRSEVVVISASYGLSCRTFAVPQPAVNWASPGNVTDKIMPLCNLSATCDVLVDVSSLGDPANGCGKDFTVVYRCSGEPGTKTDYIPAEAAGKHVVLECIGKSDNATELSAAPVVASDSKSQ